MRTGRLAAVLLLTAHLIGQSPLAMPAWLANYPGVTVQTIAFQSLVEAAYTASAKPSAVAEHYRKLFEAQNLPFVPNFDGMGTVVRGAAAECDLLITIRAEDSGTAVRVDCAAKSAPAEAWTALPDSNPRTPARVPPRPAGSRTARTPPDFQTMVAEGAERHKQLVKDLKIHPVYQDAPAPPLVWPSWLVHIKGGRLSMQAGVDRAGHDFLKTRYVTTAPMTAIHAFYEDLLNAHEYPVHGSKLETGQTISGIVQNADGYVEGHNYPNGHPGPYTEIHVGFSRFHLNDPITVDLKFTTYEFKAPPPFPQ